MTTQRSRSRKRKREMTKKLHDAVLLSAAGLMLAGLVFSIWDSELIIINTSKSVLPGLYVRSGHPSRGGYVRLCPSVAAMQIEHELHYTRKSAWSECDGGTTALLKMLAAVPGDDVRVDDDGITVNGSLIPHTRPFGYDRDGQRLPVYRLERRLQADEYLVSTDGTDIYSFDSRYFGIVHGAGMTAYRPLWQAEKEK